MKTFFLCLLLSFTLMAETSLWEVTQNIKNPESVYYDSSSEQIFVSNIVGDGMTKDGKGHISLLNKKGKVIEAQWVKNLHAPKGMRAKNGLLWVTDIDRVLAIDIKDKTIIKTYTVEGARFLNDIAIDDRGYIYISDTLTSKIHVIKNDKLELFLGGDQYDSPNGLLYLEGSLYVAAWGLTTDFTTKTPGRFYKINLKTKELKFITKPLGNLDGLERDKKGDFIISDWVAGKVFKVSRVSGKAVEVFKGLKGLADIGLIQASNTLLIPYMLDDKIMARKLDD